MPSAKSLFSLLSLTCLLLLSGCDLLDRTSDAGTGAANPVDGSTDEALPATEFATDLLRLGERILLVNHDAQRLQLVDAAQVDAPRVVAEVSTTYSPMSLFQLNEEYLLIEANRADSGLRVDLFHLVEGAFELAQAYELPDSYYDSARRGEILYLMSVDSLNAMRVTALRIGAGTLTEVASASVSFASPSAGFVDDYLVLLGSPEGDSSSTQLHLFDLRDAADPLHALPELALAGNVPSELYVDVHEQRLRVVYLPQGSGEEGATFANFELQGEPAQWHERSRVEALAPGKELYTTVFTDNTAYLVSFERSDPLWLLDLTDPAEPKVKGQLAVPNVAEKLFFHADRLFALGKDQNPTPSDGENFTSRVAALLFDVSDPDTPVELDRYRPLLDQARYTTSAALDDQRAMHLDWEHRLAAVPISTWELDVPNMLQLLDFSSDRFVAIGTTTLPGKVERIASLGAQRLAVVGDQWFTIVDWAQGDVQSPGRLKLAVDLQWLSLDENGLWAGAKEPGATGFQYLYRYGLDDLHTPLQGVALSQAYDQLLADEQHVVAFQFVSSDESTRIQVMARSSGQLWEPMELVFPALDQGYQWEKKSGAILQGDYLYLAAERLDEEWMSDGSVQLIGWQLDATGAQLASQADIQGNPIGFDLAGQLITLEAGAETEQLNLITLDGDNAQVVAQLSTACPSSQAKAHLEGGQSLLLLCNMSQVEYFAFDPLGTDGELSWFDDPDAEAAPYHLYRFNTASTLAVAAEWDMGTWGTLSLLASRGDRVLMEQTGDTGVACVLYDISTSTPQVVVEMEGCPSSPSQAAELLESEIYSAQGYADLHRQAIE